MSYPYPLEVRSDDDAIFVVGYNDLTRPVADGPMWTYVALFRSRIDADLFVNAYIEKTNKPKYLNDKAVRAVMLDMMAYKECSLNSMNQAESVVLGAIVHCLEARSNVEWNEVLAKREPHPMMKLKIIDKNN